MGVIVKSGGDCPDMYMNSLHGIPDVFGFYILQS